MKRTVLFVLIISFMVSMSIPVSASERFNDVPNGHWAEAAISYLSDRDILNGYSDGAFRPDNSISCAEFIAIVCRLSGMKDAASAGDTHWADVYISYALYKNWYANESSGYDVPITRELAAKILVCAFYNIADYQPSDNAKTITDLNKIGEYYLDYVLYAYELNLLTGYPDGSFRPNEKLTRAEVASMIYRMLSSDGQIPETAQSVEVPVLLYHHIASQGDYTVTPEKFRSDIKELLEAGYNPIFIDELYDYASGTGDLPDKPVLITFDDGYDSNWKYAFPILKEYNVKANIFVIGWSVGQAISKDGKTAIFPHFSWNKAKDMEDSGLVRICSHSYDMHDSGVRKKDGVSYSEYIDQFKGDINKLGELIKSNLGHQCIAFAYPYGDYTYLADKLLEEMGYYATFTTVPGISTVVQGDLSSIRLMDRITMDQKGESALHLIEHYLAQK